MSFKLCQYNHMSFNIKRHIYTRVNSDGVVLVEDICKYAAIGEIRDGESLFSLRGSKFKCQGGRHKWNYFINVFRMTLRKECFEQMDSGFPRAIKILFCAHAGRGALVASVVDKVMAIFDLTKLWRLSIRAGAALSHWYWWLYQQWITIPPEPSVAGIYQTQVLHDFLVVLVSSSGAMFRAGFSCSEIQIISPSRHACTSFERIQILRIIQFTMHTIEFVFAETHQLVGMSVCRKSAANAHSWLQKANAKR